MTTNAVLKWRDKDGDIWEKHHDDGYLFDSAGSQFFRESVEKKWGPLIPVEWETPPSMWTRMTATWQRRLMVVVVAINLGLFIVTTVFVIIRSEPSLYLTATLPALAITVGFPLLIFTVIRTLVWIWPSLDN